MNKFLKITIFFLFVQFAFAQDNVESRGSLSDLNTLSVGTGAWIPAKPKKNVILGSAYLFPNWIGQYKVASKSGQVVSLYNLNYNIMNQSIEASVSNDSIFQYDSDKIDYVMHDSFKYKMFNDDDFKGLFKEICNTDKMKVYKGYTVSILEGTLNPLTQEKISEDTYEQKTQYYHYVNGKFEKFKPSKKTVLKLCSDKEVEMKDYLAKHTLAFDNDKDLKILFNYYNSL